MLAPARASASTEALRVFAAREALPPAGSVPAENVEQGGGPDAIATSGAGSGLTTPPLPVALRPFFTPPRPRDLGTVSESAVGMEKGTAAETVGAGETVGAVEAAERVALRSHESDVRQRLAELFASMGALTRELAAIK